MSQLVQDKLASGKARLVSAPVQGPRHQVEVDQNFELPTSLFGATVACYLGFLAIMLAAFTGPELAIPMVIFAGFIVAGFGVPMIWTRLAGNKTKPMSMGQFRNSGVMTNTGRCAPQDAAIQMLILPVLIVFWGLAVSLIVAIVA
ncbi:MAG: hypothetical protein AAF251_09135 [Pseudomonadota bacterium]